MQVESVKSINISAMPTKGHNPAFSANTTTYDKKEIKDDTILSPTFVNKSRAKINTAKSLPSLVARGLGGDPNSNFYEFMQISRIPYFLGGPGLVATILAGKNLLDIRANKAANFNAKGMALGCAFYYLAAAIAQKCVDIPVKAFRGVDLNHPLVDVVKTKAENASGNCDEKIEQHSVFESSKFIRWDLLYNRDSKNPKEINSKYSTIAKKMGVPEDSNDTDTATKPLIMSLIKQARAWKYIIGAFAVMLGVGLGNQKIMKEEFCTGIFSKNKPDFNPKNIPATTKTKIINPLKNSFVALWKGAEGSTSSKFTGKLAIIGFLASVLMANISILKSTNKEETKFEKVKEANK